jgi:uncharacterized protein YciI
MFIVLLTYTQPLTEVDRLVPGHRSFLERNYALGHFILSGRKEPRTGGVILSAMASRTALEAVLQEDPFQREGVAQYDIIEWVPSMSAPALAHLLSP